MNEIINEIFEKYEVRKKRSEKTAFIDYTLKKAEELGYSAKVEGGSFRSRNIVVGEPEQAKVVYTAHYDTCPRLPFPNFITPKNMLIYILYQIGLTLAIVGIPFLIGFAVGVILNLLGTDSDIAADIAVFIGYFGMLALCFLMMFGPANPHTANDNTSGVITLFGIMKSLPAEQRGSVAFIFFDLEEVGLVGSSSYRSKHQKVMKNKLIINFDCVSDGKDIIFAMKPASEKYRADLEGAFSGNGVFRTEVLSRGVFYPSDQAGFRFGVGVAALKRTKRGILYMNRIHTSRDTVFERENIEFLVSGAVDLSSRLYNRC